MKRDVGLHAEDDRVITPSGASDNMSMSLPILNEAWRTRSAAENNRKFLFCMAGWMSVHGPDFASSHRWGW
jgi:hypothetical protein